MKKIFFLCVALAFTTLVFSQSDKYQKAMEKALIQFDSAHTTDQLNNSAAMFERIADAEKTQWLPYYYASLAHIRKGFTDAKLNKDDVANQAEVLTAKAEAIEPKNAEIYLLKNMAATLHMLVDPMSRYQQYGGEATKALVIAEQIDPTNPRVYFLKAQNVFGTPSQFGGGKERAKPIFETSVAMYKTYKPASNLHPTWGQKDAVEMLLKCK